MTAAGAGAARAEHNYDEEPEWDAPVDPIAVVGGSLTESENIRLERIIVSAQNGAADLRAVIGVFLESTFVVPSGSEFKDGHGDFQPVLFPKETEQMMAVFSSFGRIGTIARMAPYAVTMSGKDALRSLAPGVGVVVTPGSELGLEVSADVVASIVAQMPSD